MTLSATAELIAGLPHFQGVDRVLIERVAEGARVTDFVKDEWVFRQGEPPRAFFQVLLGGVRLHRIKPDGREQLIRRVRPGRTFAEAAVMGMRAYPVHAVATESPTRLLVVGSDPFLRLFDAEPGLARAMVAALSRRLMQLVQRVDELTVPDVSARLARYLLELPGAACDSGMSVELPVRKKELAAHLGTTPETLSRHLGRWRDAGVATSSGSRVEIRDVEHLLRLAAD